MPVPEYNMKWMIINFVPGEQLEDCYSEMYGVYETKAEGEAEIKRMGLCICDCIQLDLGLLPIVPVS